MERRREWASLSEGYRNRLIRGGVTPEAYREGQPLSSARGHAHTPERPSQAIRNPLRFPHYVERHPEIVAHRKPPPKRIIPDNIGYPDRPEVRNVIFERTAGGIDGHTPALMTTVRYSSDGELLEMSAVPYDQADFAALIREARANGYTVSVTSTGESSIGVDIASDTLQ